MQFTLENVLKIDLLATAKALTTKRKLGLKPVEWISVMEFPVENYIRKNELVLTTGIGCEDKAVFCKFVQEVIDSRASALAIATGRYVNEVPPEVLQLAEEQQFPLIQLPWEIRFSDIIQAVLSDRNGWKRNFVKQSEELQKNLLNLFLANSTLSDAAETIHQTIGTSIAIVDKAGIVKGNSPNSGTLIEKWNNYLQSIFCDSLFDSLCSLPKEVGWVYIDNAIIKVKISTNNKINGYLLIESSSQSFLDAFQANGEEHLLEYISVAVALWFQREDSIQETEMRLRDDFVWSLAKGEIDSWDMVLSRAKPLGYNVNLPYVCIVGCPENLKDMYKKLGTDPAAIHQWLQVTSRSIEQEVVHAAKSMERKIMTTYQRDYLIIYFVVSPQHMKEAVSVLLDHVENRLNTMLPGLVISWGIGRNHVKSFHESYNEAQIALDIGRRQSGPGQRSNYINIGAYRILINLAKNPEVQEIVSSTLEELMEYDKHKGFDLMNTLSVYIRNQGNVSQTARSLCLHRHTLLYRLNKIESITGRSLLDQDELFLIDLCMRLWMIGMSRQ